MVLDRVREYWSPRSVTARGDVFAFTANSVLCRSGALVMGRGSARMVRDAFPGIDREFGARVARLGRPTARGLEFGVTGVVRRELDGEHRILAVQVKYDWREPADLDLMARSLGRLARLVSPGGALEGQRIVLPFPGVANGWLPREAVWPLVKLLPDGITVLEKIE